MSSSADNADKCPVDHKARAAWLSQNTLQNPHAAPASPAPPAAAPIATTKTCTSDTLDQATPPHPTATKSSPLGLGREREVSTIPRAADASSVSNSEHGPQTATGIGHWIYPSEEMFFNAMKRKSYDPKAGDMKTVVPIHNAVNERAWKEIKDWEAGRGSEKCGGPRLTSFSGDSSKLTPKARLMVLFGYQPPFDRHDWVVDRCGKKIEYVIDFYAGKPNPLIPEMPSFYLDVRPKLSLEGAAMRLERFVKSFWQ